MSDSLKEFVFLSERAFLWTSLAHLWNNFFCLASKVLVELRRESLYGDALSMLLYGVFGLRDILCVQELFPASMHKRIGEPYSIDFFLSAKIIVYINMIKQVPVVLICIHVNTLPSRSMVP